MPRWSLGVVALGAILILVASTASASSPANRTFTPPYVTASTIAHQWSNSTGVGRTLVSTATANRSTGIAALNLSASAASLYSSQVGTASPTAASGFQVPFHVSTNRTHTITVNWTLSWNSSASGSGCNAAGRCSEGNGQGRVYLLVIDRTNHTTYVSGPPAYKLFVSFYSSRAMTFSSGRLDLSLTLKAYLVSGHSYIVKTYLWAFAAASAPHLSGAHSATATFDMAAPYGGALNWVSIR